MSVFKFQKFDIEQNGCAQKVGTDSMVLGAFVTHDQPKRVLDVGTGNGVLALMMAQKFKNAQILGVEIQNKCAEVAQSNFRNSNYKNQLNILNSDINSCQFSNKFDLIISNPPFFDNSMEPSSAERTSARHQSALKLNQLISFASENLIVGGALWLIVPVENYENLLEESNNCGMKLSLRVKVYGKPGIHKRDILCFFKTEEMIRFTNEVFTIRNTKGDYTDQYKIKTVDFHHTRL